MASQHPTLKYKLYQNCHIQLKLGTTLKKVPYTTGVQQGDNMAPILFLFVMQAVMQMLKKILPVSKPEYRFFLNGKGHFLGQRTKSTGTPLTSLVSSLLMMVPTFPKLWRCGKSCSNNSWPFCQMQLRDAHWYTGNEVKIKDRNNVHTSHLGTSIRRCRKQNTPRRLTPKWRMQQHPLHLQKFDTLELTSPLNSVMTLKSKGASIKPKHKWAFLDISSLAEM